MTKAPIGATVHYVGADHNGESRIPCLPAIVTDHLPSGDLELFVINHGDTYVAQAEFGRRDDYIPRTWHLVSASACDGGYSGRWEA